MATFTGSGPRRAGNIYASRRINDSANKAQNPLAWNAADISAMNAARVKEPQTAAQPTSWYNTQAYQDWRSARQPSQGSDRPVVPAAVRPNGAGRNQTVPTRQPIQGLSGQLAAQGWQNGRYVGTGTAGGGAGTGGDANYWINRQFQENQAMRDLTLEAINKQNQMLGAAGQALQNDPLQQQARTAAAANFAGSGPEALNQASSRINAAANLQGLQNRFLAGEQGQVGGSGLSAMNAATENQRIAGLGQVASEAAQRRFAEQQAAIGQANQLATGQAQFGLQAVDARVLPNFQPQDFSGIGSLLGMQQMSGALGAGLGAIGAGIGALGASNQGQMYQAGVPYSQYGDPTLSAMGNPGLASAMGLALASGRTPVALSNNDPRLAQALGQVNSRWGGAVNAQDSIMAQAMQAARGFGPNEMEATQRTGMPWSNPVNQTQMFYGNGAGNPLSWQNRQPSAFRSASPAAGQGGAGGAGGQGGQDGNGNAGQNTGQGSGGQTSGSSSTSSTDGTVARKTSMVNWVSQLLGREIA